MTTVVGSEMALMGMVNFSNKKNISFDHLIAYVYVFRDPSYCFKRLGLGLINFTAFH